jgi:hypothetical protein
VRARLVVPVAILALLALPVAAAAHPTSTNSFISSLGMSSATLTHAPVDDGGADHATSRNMRLLDFLERAPRPNPNQNAQWVSDLAFWGDTAYQGTFSGFRIIDIDNPSRLEELIDYRDCANPNGAGQGDVVVWGSILVRTWDSNTPAAGATCDGDAVPAGFEGLHVFDVSDPGNPDLVASVDLACGSHTASGVPDLKNRRLIVYSTPSSGACDGVDVVEVPLSRPNEAEFLRFEFAGSNATTANGFACHDTGIILGRAMKVACAGGVGFAVWSIGGADGGSIDNPRFLYNKVVGHGVTIGHSAAFDYDGETIIFGHEPGGGVNPRCMATGTVLNSAGTLIQDDDMKTFFFYNTDSGEEIGTWTLTREQTLEENCTLHNYNLVPTDDDDILVHGSYQSGIGVLDFSNLDNPREIAYADPAPLPPVSPTTPFDGGDWATYVYNGVLYETDMNRGLYTWRVDEREFKDSVRLRHMNPQTQEFTIGAKRDHDRWNEDDRWHDDDDDPDRD